jgi:hypothetical protein
MRRERMKLSQLALAPKHCARVQREEQRQCPKASREFLFWNSKCLTFSSEKHGMKRNCQMCFIACNMCDAHESGQKRVLLPFSGIPSQVNCAALDHEQRSVNGLDKVIHSRERRRRLAANVDGSGWQKGHTER